MSAAAQLDLLGDPPQRRYKGGYASDPGSGPDGMTCRRCGHLCRVRYHGVTYSKCELTVWTHGRGSDISMHAPACRRFALEQPEQLEQPSEETPPVNNPLNILDMIMKTGKAEA